MNKLNHIYIFSIYMHVITRDEATVICHLGNGRFVKMPTECWGVIRKYMKDYTPEEICDAADKEDYGYYKLLFEKLLDAKLLVLSDEEHLEEVDLILTNRCNLKCIHCCADALDMRGTDALETSEWFRIVDILEKQKVNRISITGGEPMVRKDFFDIVEYIAHHFSGTLSLSTNGTLITEENVGYIANNFCAISISVDGYDEETCSQIRGKDVFSKVMNSVKLLIDAGFNPHDMSLSMVDTVVTHNGKEKFEQLCAKFKVKPLIRVFSATGRGSNEEWLRVEEEKKSYGAVYLENEDLKDSIKSSYLSCQNCNAGRTRLAIDSRGNVFPCLVLENKEYCMGNILVEQNLLSDIWNYYGENCLESGCNIMHEAFDKLLISHNEKCASCDVAPFCHMCLEAFKAREENIGIEGICNSNKEFLTEVIWNR